MSDADRILMTFQEETTFGAALGSGVKFITARIVGESIGRRAEYITSNELRSDRNVADVILGEESAAGDIDVELSYGSHDYWIEAALQSADWTAAGTPVVVTATAVASTGVITRTSGDFTAGFALYDFVHITNATFTVLVQITAITTTTITVRGQAILDVGVAQSTTFTRVSRIQNGTEARSFNVQKQFTDLASEFHLYTGLVFNGVELTIEPGSIVTAKFNTLAKNQTRPAAVTGDGAPIAATSTSPMNAIRNVVGVSSAGTIFSITRLQLTIGNQARARTQVAASGPVSFGYGRLALTGRLEFYFVDHVTLDKFIADTPTDILVVLADGAGNRYAIDIPQLKFTSHDTVASGTNTDVVVQADFTAYLNATRGYAIRIGRHGV